VTARCFRRRPDIGETEVDADLFLVDPRSEEIYHLDAHAAGLWRLLAEPRDRAEIEQVFAAAFPEADADRVRRDLDQALRRLQAQDLIVAG